MTAPEGGRLLTAPIFILSPARAGSTLLRMILGSHSTLYAPPELPLGHLSVRAETTWIKASMKELQISEDELDFLLWDRVFADVLTRSGKPTLVAKTPANVLIFERIAQCWPDARFIFLMRHPLNCVASLNKAWSKNWRPEDSGSLDESMSRALRYMKRLEEARHALDGKTIRYEDLTAEPETIVRQLCKYLGVQFEAEMLEYGEFGHGRIGAGLGDTSAKLKSGRIQPAAAPPDIGEVPEELARMCATWGYMVPKQGSSSDGTEGAADMAELSADAAEIAGDAAELTADKAGPASR
jgi:sulfotransferase family protein